MYYIYSDIHFSALILLILVCKSISKSLWCVNVHEIYFIISRFLHILKYT